MAAIALAYALPSLQQFSANNQIVATSNSIISGLNYARFLSITTGDEITICPTANGTACADDNWHLGWIVFADADGDSAADADEIVRVLAYESEVAGSGFGAPIVFESDGTTALGSNATITNCFAHSGITEKCIAVVVNAFGAIHSQETVTETEEA